MQSHSIHRLLTCKTTMNTFAQHRPQAAGAAADRVPRPFWNPYVAGFFLGLVLLATYLVTGRGLGATAGFAAVATWLVSLVAPGEMLTNAVHVKYWKDGAPLANWTLFLLLGAIVGAAISGWQGNRFKWSVERGPRVTDSQRLALAFVGGFIAAYGAKIAKGCTSGQALTGGSILNVGSLVFMLAVFAAAYGFAYFLRREWL
jgi:uncharacterized membrane protein YedE/YeeE